MKITYFGTRPDGHIVKIKHSNGNITHLKHQIVRHSPTGFSWGYAGAGPADLALNILIDYCQRTHRSKAIAERFYQDFKWDFIAQAKEDLKIEGEVIEIWLCDKLREYDSMLLERVV